MKTLLSKGIRKTAMLHPIDLYPLAGIVSIATYIVVECFLT